MLGASLGKVVVGIVNEFISTDQYQRGYEKKKHNYTAHHRYESRLTCPNISRSELS